MMGLWKHQSPKSTFSAHACDCVQAPWLTHTLATTVWQVDFFFVGRDNIFTNVIYLRNTQNVIYLKNIQNILEDTLYLQIMDVIPHIYMFLLTTIRYSLIYGSISFEMGCRPCKLVFTTREKKVKPKMASFISEQI